MFTADIGLKIAGVCCKIIFVFFRQYHGIGVIAVPSKQKEHLIKILDEISNITELRNIPGFMEESARLQERLSDDEFRIAVVGEFSSGKSTFINAMLGQDVLQHATTETTAAVTRIVNVAPDDPRRMKGRVTTRDGRQIPLPDLKELKEYTTTQSLRYQNRVPDEIDSVEIYLPFMALSRPIVLVDTPGLNGMADGHREQTVSLIQKAHACIYLIPRGGIGESDILFLEYLARFQKNFIFIQNFIDEFQASQGDSVPGKLAEQRRILDRKIFAQNPECVHNICGISALMELASADQRIDRLYADSPKTLTLEDRLRLHEQSGFEDFRRMMSQTFQEDRMDEIQYGGTSRAIANWIQSLLDYISRQEQQAREFFDASRDKRALEKLDHLREKILAGEQRQRENLQNFIIARGDEIRKEEYSSLKENLEQLNRDVFAEINAKRTIAELDEFEKKLSGRLEKEVGTILADGSLRLRQKFQTLYQVLLTKIDEFRGVKSTEDLNLETLTLSSLPAEQKSFAPAQGRIERWKNELNRKKEESSRLENESAQIAGDLRKASQDLTLTQRARQDVETQRDKDLARMGSRPAAREYEEAYTASVPHGGLGILDALFGYKEVTRYRTRRDDSAGEAWDQRRAQIQNAFVAESDKLSKELAAARRRKENLTAQKEANQTKLKSVEDKIRQLERNIAVESEKLEKEKKHAAQEYLNLCRSALQKQVQEYLLGEESSVLTRTETNMASVAEQTEQTFIRLAMDRFTKALQQKLQWIEQMKQEKSPEILQQAVNLNEICQQLQKILTEMERG